MLKPRKWFATFLIIHTPHSYEAQDFIPEKYFHRTYKEKTQSYRCYMSYKSYMSYMFYRYYRSYRSYRFYRSYKSYRS